MFRLLLLYTENCKIERGFLQLLPISRCLFTPHFIWVRILCNRGRSNKKEQQQRIRCGITLCCCQENHFCLLQDNVVCPVIVYLLIPWFASHSFVLRPECWQSWIIPAQYCSFACSIFRLLKISASCWKFRKIRYEKHEFATDILLQMNTDFKG